MLLVVFDVRGTRQELLSFSIQSSKLSFHQRKEVVHIG